MDRKVVKYYLDKQPLQILILQISCQIFFFFLTLILQIFCPVYFFFNAFIEPSFALKLDCNNFLCLFNKMNCVDMKYCLVSVFFPLEGCYIKVKTGLTGLSSIQYKQNQLKC